MTKRSVTVGDYVDTGSPLFTVIDLTNVWVMFEAYETDLSWLNTGDSVRFNLQAFPGEVLIALLDRRLEAITGR